MINSIFQFVLASFTSPVPLTTSAGTLLLALPLIAGIAVVYKAIKVDDIKFLPFLKESFLLFSSIFIFMVVTAIVIFAIMKLVIG